MYATTLKIKKELLPEHFMNVKSNSTANVKNGGDNSSRGHVLVAARFK